MTPLRRLLRWLWLAACLWPLLGWPVQAQSLQPVPELKTRVMDFTDTLGERGKAKLEAKLAQFEKAKGSQIVVLMVPTTQPEDIAAYSHRVASTWKVGRKEVGDGIVMVVAKNDRRMRIEVARALEGAVTDLQAKRIMDERMMPRFRQGDFAGGIDSALDALMALVSGEDLPAPGDDKHRSSTPPTDYTLGELLGWAAAGYGVMFVVLTAVISVGRAFFIAVVFLLCASVPAVPVWWLTHSSDLTALVLLLPFIFVVLYAIALGAMANGRSTSPRDGFSSYSSGSSSWESSSDSSSSWSGSGGGGDFGGGGASGSW